MFHHELEVVRENRSFLDTNNSIAALNCLLIYSLYYLVSNPLVSIVSFQTVTDLAITMEAAKEEDITVAMEDTTREAEAAKEEEAVEVKGDLKGTADTMGTVHIRLLAYS